MRNSTQRLLKLHCKFALWLLGFVVLLFSLGGCSIVPPPIYSVRKFYEGPKKPLTELSIVYSRTAKILDIDIDKIETEHSYGILARYDQEEHHLLPGEHKLKVISTTQGTAFGNYSSPAVLIKGEFKKGFCYDLVTLVYVEGSTWWHKDAGYTEEYLQTDSTGKIPFRIVISGEYRCEIMAPEMVHKRDVPEHWKNFWIDNLSTLSHVEYVMYEGLLGENPYHIAKFEMENLSSNYKQGWQALSRGEYANAINAFTKAISTCKKDSCLKWETAFERNNNIQEAGHKFIESIQINEKIKQRILKSKNPTSYEQKQIEKIKEKSTEFHQIIPNIQERTELYINKGVANERNGNFKDAVEDFNIAIKLEDNYALSYFNRGVVRYKAGLRKEAIADMKKAKEFAGATKLGSLSERMLERLFVINSQL